MGHKYLDEIPFFTKYDKISFPNAKIKKNDSRKKVWKKERKEYGFDSRETWSMDFTLACWIYEHFKWFLDNAPIDLTLHKLDIEVVVNENDDSLKTEVQKVSQKEAIEYVLRYFEYYFRQCCTDIEDQYYICAMRIVTELMPFMWW